MICEDDGFVKYMHRAWLMVKDLVISNIKNGE